MSQSISSTHRLPLTQAPAETDPFELFISKNWEKAVRMAWRLTGEDREIAEDVAQEAFLKAHGALSSFRHEAKLSTWFYRILIRQAANHRRWRGVRVKWQGLLEAMTTATVSPIPSDPFLQDSIASALNQLSTKQRSVFILTHLEGFSVSQAAQIMGCATGTAKSHLHRALQSLRRELEKTREVVE
jgi:RNA polymerase sigma-70 factor (ECF subfamily)